MNFGNTAIGRTGSVTITLTNNATTAVTLAPPFADRRSRGGGRVQRHRPGVRRRSARGASTTITVFFQPLTAAPFVATLAITSANGGSLALRCAAPDAGDRGHAGRG